MQSTIQTEIKKLSVFIADNRISKSKLAAELNVHKSRISYWLDKDYYIAYNVGRNECALMKVARKLDFNVFHRSVKN